MLYTWDMNIETLYEMTAAAARNAERMCAQEGGSPGGLAFQNYAGYPFYVDEYNKLLTLAAGLVPEIATCFSTIDLGAAMNPMATRGPMWKGYAEQAALRLTTLASFLKGQLGTKEQEYEQIIDVIYANLRASIYQDPKNERDVQDTLETIFRARALDYLRERDTVPYSTKRYIPDFTFNRLGLAVEVKYCKDKDREKDLIDEINADIIGYAGRYDRTIFVIYDLGFIRDVPQFSSDIEKNPNVHVVIVKK